MAELRETVKRETEQLRDSTQRETDEMRAAARRDAEETIESAEMRARELARSAETVWRERRRLIEDMLAVGEQLVAIGETEGKRFPRFGEEGSEVAELLREREPAPALAGRMRDAGRRRGAVQRQPRGGAGLARPPDAKRPRRTPASVRTGPPEAGAGRRA